MSTEPDIAEIDENGVITPVKTGMFSIKVYDKTYGTSNDDNGFYKEILNIEVVEPVVIEGRPANNAMESGKENIFTAAGGKENGQVNWEASSGTIDADGKFRAPVVTGETKIIIITAYDKTYNQYQAVPVKTEQIVSVFAPMSIAETPDDYNEGTPSTVADHLQNLGMSQ